MRNKRRVLSKSVLAVVSLMLLSIVVLVGFRINASQLERILGELDRGIERYSAEELELKQEYSALVSPMKIYSYCKEKLGMERARKVETVRVQNSSYVADMPRPAERKDWRSSVFSIFGFVLN